MHGSGVPSNPADAASADQNAADRERAARRVIQARVGPPRERPSAVRLLEDFLGWSGRSPDGPEDDRRDVALAALALLPAMRREADALEAAVLFAAKGTGLTWAQMAGPLGLGSPQAAQQRLERITARQP